MQRMMIVFLRDLTDYISLSSLLTCLKCSIYMPLIYIKKVSSLCSIPFIEISETKTMDFAIDTPPIGVKISLRVVFFASAMLGPRFGAITAILFSQSRDDSQGQTITCLKS